MKLYRITNAYSNAKSVAGVAVLAGLIAWRLVFPVLTAGLFIAAVAVLALGKNVPVSAVLFFLAAACAWYYRAHRTSRTPIRWQDLPGVPLEEADSPELFRLVRETAREFSLPMPEEVRCVLDYSMQIIFPGESIMKRGARVLGIGLPLFVSHSPSELKAMIAHEFAHIRRRVPAVSYLQHYFRQRIIDTTAARGSAAPGGLPPRTVTDRLFLRISDWVLHNEEIIADRKSAEVAGAGTRIKALRKYGYGTIFAHYWNHEVSKLLQLGYLPPILEGFSYYMQRALDDAPGGHVMHAVHPERESEQYHYHPPVEERIDALKDLPAGDDLNESDPDRVLLAECRDIERRLIKNKYGEGVFDTLTPIEWDRVAQEVHLPFWEEISRSNQSALSSVTVTDIPRLSHEIGNLDETSSIARGLPDDENITEFLEFLVGSSLSVVLARAGFELIPMTMHNPTFSRGDVTVKPFTIIKDLRRRAIRADEWTAMADKLGIGEIPLASDI